ncbi:hypothetical protein SRABI118_01548 [Massilia sp. Bi118]|uniref:hypothetical protein n=1 Tax=Massilia sp. Bi118 TaxID=2822346 RepID=UPI001D7A1DA1|nr:hypothetical protein [Massilia sp. Bi118]CAH0193159.1 hypothetical protein SRABI118_01548 [Massilia sp. Bi118]
MIELFLSELRRFRTAAILYAAASLVLVTVMNQMNDLATGPRELHAVMTLLYALSGLGFALYQFGTYRQPSRWIWLLHRPLHRGPILAGIALASVVLIALAMALPLFVLLGVQDHFTTRVVDARHYAGIGFMALTCVSYWLSGAYIMLHRSRWAFVVLMLPILLTMHMASYGTMLALALACNAVLLVLVYTVFRPNRYTGDDTVATVASAAPLQLSFYIALLWSGSTLFQVGQMMAGVHPLEADEVVAGGGVEASRFDPREALLAGLAAVKDPRAAGWIAALDRDNSASLGPGQRQYTVRDTVSTRSGLKLSDSQQNNWTFSHDRMMYSGQTRHARGAGWFGAGGKGNATPFDSQPVPLRDNRARGYLANAHDMYEFEQGGLKLRHVLHVAGVEQLGAGIAVLGPRTALLTNRRVALLEERGGQLAPLASIPLPLPFGDLDRAEVGQVADGTLVSFIGGRRRLDGVIPAPQVVYLVDAGGQVRELGRREVAHDFPVLFEHRDWWVSPVLHAAVSLPTILIERGVVPDDGASRFAPLLLPRPASVWTVAVALALLSALAAAWWTRRAALGPRARLAWCLACLLLGVPALLSLMVLQPRVAREAAAASDVPVAASA